MAYRIDHGPAITKKMINGAGQLRWQTMTAVMIFGFIRSMLPLPSAIRKVLGTLSSYWMGFFVYLLLFVLLVKQSWPEGTDKLKTYLLPGGEGTDMAIETLVDRIHDGEPLGQALEVFCRQIIDNAQTD